MEILELNATLRTSIGNSPSRALRREGNIPAVLYGPGSESVLLSVGAVDLEHALKKASASQIIFNMAIQNTGAGARTAMIKELQTHPLSRKFLHVDFYEISKDRKIRVNVPVVIKGKCKGVEDGGMLQVIQREVEVMCLPFDVPQSIPIDITELEIGDSVHVKDLKVSENIELPAEINYTILTILSTKSDERTPGEEAAEESAKSKPAGK